MSLKETVESASAAEPKVYTVRDVQDGETILAFLDTILPEHKNNLYIQVENFPERVNYITPLMNYPYADKFGDLVIL